MKSSNIIKFTKDIYSKNSISETIADYADLCTMELSEDSKYYSLEVSNFDKTDVNFIDEVKNYALEGCL